jgi:hypothetical protein
MNDDSERKCATCGAPAKALCSHLRNDGNLSRRDLAIIRRQINPALIDPAAIVPAPATKEKL